MAEIGGFRHPTNEMVVFNVTSQKENYEVGCAVNVLLSMSCREKTHDRSVLQTDLSVLNVAADPRVSMPVVPEGSL